MRKKPAITFKKSMFWFGRSAPSKQIKEYDCSEGAQCALQAAALASSKQIKEYDCSEGAQAPELIAIF